MYSVERIEVTVTVPSIEETVAWYERVLEWEGHYDAFDAEGHCVFGSVSRKAGAADSAEGFKGLNLSRARDPEGEQNAHSRARVSAWVFVDDVDQVHATVVENGATPDSEPEDQPWGGRTFRLRDVNGLSLTFVEMVESDMDI